MKTNISFTLNGSTTAYTGNPSARLLDVLRGEYRLTGTKCGCLEGECGACSVIIDGKLRNSCLVAMGSLEGCDVVTIEGYSKTARFDALQKAYASVSAVQCGFCTPGMILASECLLADNPKPTERDIREAISGNLCRCTGYNAIVKAIGIAAEKMPPAKSERFGAVFRVCGAPMCRVSRHIMPTTSEKAQQIACCWQQSEASISPVTLKEALTIRRENPDIIPYSGGTDLMVEEDSGDKRYLHLSKIPELKQIIEDKEHIRFGAACTFSDVIRHELTPGILKDMCRQIAAPAIRSAGTVGGNIANGSAKADAALIFMVTDSKLRIARAGSERIIPIKDFYLGGGRVDLACDELITEVLMPKHGIGNYYLKKVGARGALAISRVSFAGILDIQDGIIRNCAIAFGAVIDTIIRRPDIDNMLIGKTIDEAKLLKDKYLAAYDAAIVPRRGRVSAPYRKDVCMNLLKDFLDSNGI